MIIETKVPEDVRKYKTKVMGPFTARQLICTGIAIGVDIPIALLLFRSDMDIINLVYIIVLIDIPVMLFAFNVNKIPMGTFIFRILLPNLFTPAKRRNTTCLQNRDSYKPTSKDIKQRNKREAKAGIKSYS